MAALLTSTAFGVVVPAMAQESADAGSNVIVVTAQKREQNLQDVPIAINAIGNEKLDQLQVSELQDVVKFLPSVTIQQGGPGFAQVYFRGVASGENDADQPESGKLSFLNPMAQMYFDSGNSQLQFPYQTGSYALNLKPGQLVLFPSWVPHQVMPFYGEGERITVAFNCAMSLR